MPGWRTRAAGILVAACAGAGLVLSAPFAAGASLTDAREIARPLAASGALSGAAADATAQIQNAQRQFNAGNYSGAISTLQAARNRIRIAQRHITGWDAATTRYAITTTRSPRRRSRWRLTRKIPFTISGWAGFTGGKRIATGVLRMRER